MSTRKKRLIVSLSSFWLAIGAAGLISAIDLKGYALLPFIIVFGLSVYVSVAAFIYSFFPKRDPAEDTFWGIIFSVLFAWF